MWSDRVFHRAAWTLALVALCACPMEVTAPADDDATSAFTGDDDTTPDPGSDDDTSEATPPLDEPTASYPEEESWFAIAPGQSWRFLEQLGGGPEMVEDDVLLTVERTAAASSLDPEWPQSMVAYEFVVDRTFGGDERHWYGIDGRGGLRWLRSERSDLFDVVVTDGDGGSVLGMAEAMSLLLDERWDGAFLLPDVAQDLDTVVFDIVEIEAIGLDGVEIVIEDAGTPRGTMVWRPHDGLHLIDVELSGQQIRWSRIN